MTINIIKPISFNSQYKSPLLQKLSVTPKTNQQANDYFLTVDEATRAIPTDYWDELYALDTEDKLNLSDYLKATYLTRPRYSKYELKNAKPISPTIKNLLSCEKILTEEEIEKIENKMQGAIQPEKMNRYLKCGFEKSEEFLGNIWFLKELAADDNKDIFDRMSPNTASAILFNFLFTYNDFSTALESLREDDALTMPNTNSWTTRDEVKRYQREVIHEYLLGESYSKISESDYRLSQLERNRPSTY